MSFRSSELFSLIYFVFLLTKLNFKSKIKRKFKITKDVLIDEIYNRDFNAIESRFKKLKTKEVSGKLNN